MTGSIPVSLAVPAAITALALLPVVVTGPSEFDYAQLPVKP
jgi:hypothetical protein